MDFYYKYTDNSKEGYIDDYSDNSHYSDDYVINGFIIKIIKNVEGLIILSYFIFL